MSWKKLGLAGIVLAACGCSEERKDIIEAQCEVNGISVAIVYNQMPSTGDHRSIELYQNGRLVGEFSAISEGMVHCDDGRTLKLERGTIIIKENNAEKSGYSNSIKEEEEE